MKEIAPGLFHWTAIHDRIGIEVGSHYWSPGRVLIDPMLPAEGLEWFRGPGAPPEHVVLTNRHHYRHAARFVEAFGCEVWCHAEGLHEFTRVHAVRGFRPGDPLPGGLEAFEIGAICPDETAIVVPAPGGAVALADGLVREGDGPLSFVPDSYLGGDPEGVKRGLREAYRRLAREREFDVLLLAHGHPWIGGAREALSRFVTGNGA